MKARERQRRRRRKRGFNTSGKKRKEVKKEQESMQRGGKERRESDKTSAGAGGDHPFYRAAEVRHRSARGGDLQVYTFTGTYAHKHTQRGNRSRHQ